MQYFNPTRPQHADSKATMPDLDCESRIDELVLRFYFKLLNDSLMAPLFYDVAAIDVGTHIPKIALYWYKMLLADKRYKRHTMKVHRELDAKFPVRGEHHERWLYYFIATVDGHFAGPKADFAKRLATRFSHNFYWQTQQIVSENPAVAAQYVER